jgi:hypothetical protein
MLVSKTTRKKKTYSRFNQIVKWCGADFEGCIGTSRPFTTHGTQLARARACVELAPGDTAADLVASGRSL